VPPDFVHRELLLPSPTEEPPAIAPLVWAHGDPFCLEIHREKEGRVRYALGARGTVRLDSMLSYLESVRPRLAGGDECECLARTLFPEGLYAQAVPTLNHHHLPLVVQPKLDPADHLLRLFASPPLRDHDVRLQLLFRNVGGWESNFLSPSFGSVAEGQSHIVRTAMHARHNQAGYHVELRSHIVGPYAPEALGVLGTWLSGWTTVGGAAWRRWWVVPPKKEWAFHGAIENHCMEHFVTKAGRRDVSGLELSRLLSIPWSTHHPVCNYSGAPRGKPPPELVVRPPESPRAPVDPRIVAGLSGSYRVALPRRWNHATILGRTQTGKSTAAMALALQILRKQPGSTVVVIEPTGTLVEGIVSRLPGEVASESIEVDPAHPTFEENGITKVSVPLSLLHAPEKGSESFERWTEALAGDLLTAIRSAWGEESVGGRAELVLRALVQGLARSPDSNLVDAYQILTSKPALQRFVKSAAPGPLRDFLEHHLPRLDYNFTMSTLDKVGKIATNPILRVALCQRSHAVSFDRLLQHRLLLLNLSKAALGADGANFLAAVYLTQLWAAIQRSGRPEKPIYLFLDEVHNYASPTLADMLSEGAKYGLHVVAVTQYLHRVPPRIQAALLGNVDVWLLFSLGVEDMEDAWKIVHGESHGWTPQDLVDGLKPHEVALATSGSLLKLETRACAPPGPDSEALKGFVTASSRRYAQSEDSEASPWLVDQNDLEAVLNGLAHRSRTLEELGGITSLRADKLAAALTRSEEAGDVERDSEEQSRVRLTPRGSVHLCALEGRRNEGEDHVETLVDLCMFLDARSIAVTIPEQVAGVLMPDGQFRYGEAVYNVEVECSTVAKAAEQVVRNVRKAREAGNRVLIALPDASNVQRLLAVLDGAFPGLRLWPDGVGVVWRGEDGLFHPHQVPGTQPWPFLEDDWDKGIPALPLKPGGEPGRRDTAFPELTDPLVRRLRSIVQAFLVKGRIEVTYSDLFEALSPPERTSLSEEQVGRALSALGIQGRRVKVNGTRYRVYELSESATVLSDPAVRPGRDPTARTDAETIRAAQDWSNERWASDSPIENHEGDPEDPAGPDD
jgi:hypothetical protein